VLVAIVGFGWAGWQTDGAAKERANQQTHAAVTAALAPVCVDAFRRDPLFQTHLSELKALDPWGRGLWIVTGGWGKTKGVELDADAARLCATQLLEG
jgi:hypothetical protein